MAELRFRLAHVTMMLGALLALGATGCGDDSGDDGSMAGTGAGTGTTGGTGGGGGGMGGAGGNGGSGGMTATAGMGGSGGSGGTGGAGGMGGDMDAGGDAGDDAGMDAATDAGTDSGTDASDEDAGDPCSDVANPCTTPGVACDGDNLVSCMGDADGCLVETVTDCTMDGNNLCDDSLATPVCAFDPCLGVSDVCDTAGVTCDDDELVECADNGSGCLVETRTDCTMGGNNFCDASQDPPECAFDPCHDLEDVCDTAGTTCDGVNLVVCADNGSGCLIETVTDCTMDGDNNTCDDAPTTPVCADDPCKDDDGVDKENVCVVDETTCADDVLVTCVDDADGCPIATPTDCTMDGGNNFCDADAVPPQCDFDPCLEVEEPCFPAGVTCDGNELVTCAQDTNSCLVETREDCEALGAGSVCDDSDGSAACEACVSATDCDSGQVAGDTLCVGNTRVLCADQDSNSCLEAVREDCGDDFICCTGEDAPTAGCPAVSQATCVYDAGETCDEEVAAVFDAPASYADLATSGAGNDYNDFPCPNPDLPFLAGGADLLYALDIPSQTSMTVSFVAPTNYVFGLWMLQLTECADNGAPAEDSCVAVSNRSLTQANETASTQRFYLVIDADTSPADGSFGLEVDIRPLACGDGHKDGTEECDDGANLPDDGCGPDCMLEEDFACTQSTPDTPSVCTRRPEDGVCGNVQCDDLPDDAPDGLELCCTTAQACGVARSDRYGASCLGREQEGEIDDECESADSGLVGFFFGYEDLDGCCRPSGACGLISPEGGGCVERAAYWQAMLDGAASAIYEGPLMSDTCTP